MLINWYYLFIFVIIFHIIQAYLMMISLTMYIFVNFHTIPLLVISEYSHIIIRGLDCIIVVIGFSFWQIIVLFCSRCVFLWVLLVIFWGVIGLRRGLGRFRRGFRVGVSLRFISSSLYLGWLVIGGLVGRRGSNRGKKNLNYYYFNA